jgi:hypothetical protein
MGLPLWASKVPLLCEGRTWQPKCIQQPSKSFDVKDLQLSWGWMTQAGTEVPKVTLYSYYRSKWAWWLWLALLWKGMAENLWSLLAHFTAPIVIEYTAEFTKLNPLSWSCIEDWWCKTGWFGCNSTFFPHTLEMQQMLDCLRNIPKRLVSIATLACYMISQESKSFVLNLDWDIDRLTKYPFLQGSLACAAINFFQKGLLCDPGM